MRLIGELIRLVLAVVLVVVVVLGAATAFVTQRSLPTTDGRLTLEDLDDEVTVLRDPNGVVDIYATTAHDLFLAQGFIHAQERMWQMEVWRHIGAGRLSELFGAGQVDTDRFIRVVGWRRAAERDRDALSDEARAALEAYADGVNAWLAAHEGSMPLPFVVVEALGGSVNLGGYEPEPWIDLDTLTWAKVQAWNLGGNIDSEIFRVLADARLGDPSRTDELFPAYRDDAPVIVSPDALAGVTTRPTAVHTRPAARSGGGTGHAPGIDPDAATALAGIARTANAIGALAGLGPERGVVGAAGVGSNDWVVGPELSASGEALLANDPHLGISMPSIWFLNGLHCRPLGDACPYDVTGVSFPGAPSVIIGHNARIAWGVTNANPDVQDLFVERPDPSDDGNYLAGDSSVPFDTRTETIEVRGGADIEFAVRETAHGPILNDADERLRDLDELYALRWTAIAEPDRIYDAFLGLNRAAGWDDFRQALSNLGAPSQNFVYADVEGHIGYQLPGRVPIRAQDGDRGARPVPGWDLEHEWTGYVPFDELPSALDPVSGRIVTANNPIHSDRHFIGLEFDRGDRAASILAGLDEAASEGITADEMAAVQLRTELGRAERTIPALLALDPAPQSDDGRAVLAAIREWDRDCGVDSIGCTAYLVTEFLLHRAVFDDELGPVARDYIGSGYAEDLLARLLAEPGSTAVDWWDDTTTEAGETARDVLAATLDRTGQRLREELGELGDWRWGRIHQATFREGTLGSGPLPPLRWYLNAGPTSVPGADGAVNNTYYRLDRAYADPYDPDVVPKTALADLFEVTNLPSLRLVVDMGDLDGARIVTTTGQSGNPFDGHYGDLVDEWATGETIPLRFGDAAVEDAAVATLVLGP